MSKLLYPVHHVNSPNQVTCKFRFQINGTSDPDNVVPGNTCVTEVTRTSAGLFVITFAEKFPVFLGAVGAVLESTQAHDLICKFSVGGYDASTGLLTMTVVGADGSTAAEDPADNDWVYIEATFCRNSTQAPSAAI